MAGYGEGWGEPGPPAPVAVTGDPKPLPAFVDLRIGAFRPCEKQPSSAYSTCRYRSLCISELPHHVILDADSFLLFSCWLVFLSPVFDRRTNQASPMAAGECH